METIRKSILGINNSLDHLKWAPPLLSRLVLGWVFFWAGYGKLGNLEPVIGFFESIGIPFASIQAPMIAVLELIGGACLIFGLGTRIFSALLAATMAVALMTAHADDIAVFSDLFKIYEFIYILVFTHLFVHGGGKVSIDSIIAKKHMS